MKCTHCGADTTVRETRLFKTMFLKRTRVCFNKCRPIVTVEIPIGSISDGDLTKIERGTAKRAVAYQAKQLVTANAHLTAGQIALKTGLKLSHVETIRHRTKETA